MRRLLGVLILAAVACENTPTVMVPPPQPPPGSPGQFQDVGTLGAWTKGTGLDSAGTVVASSAYAEHDTRLYPVYSNNGIMRRLDAHPNHVEGHSIGMADAINQRGQIAGIVAAQGAWQVARWDTAGRLLSATPLPFVGSLETHAVEISNSGAILGWIEDNPDHRQSFLVRDGVLTALGHLGVGDTHPFDLNERGQAVGTSGWFFALPPPGSDSPRDTTSAWTFYHPFLWTDGSLHDLGVFGKTTACSRAAPCASGAAVAINEHGDVVGWSEDNALIKRPFLWRAGVLQDLGALPGKNAAARAINGRGQIAGDGDGVAFLWENGVTRVLGSLGGSVTRVTAMNEAGDVVGTGLTPSGEQHAWIWRAGAMIDLGIPFEGACAAKAVAVNARGDVLIDILRRCQTDPSDPGLSSFFFIQVQRAVVWHPPTP